MKYVIVHGSFGSPEGNWFPRLKEKLELLNQEVAVPRFPVDDWDEVTKRGEKTTTRQQTVNNWLKVWEKEVVPWVGRDKVVIVAHSLGPLFIMHALSKFKLKVDAAIMVSPFLDIPRNKEYWQIDVANKTFYGQKFDFTRLKKMMPLSFVLYSDGDPYVPAEKAKEFASKLGSSMIPVLGGKHLSSEFNQNEFPLVLELCKSRIKLTLYQKYLAHISEYHPTDVVRKGKERALFLPSSELAKEGTFHFRNLEREGFCVTKISKVDYWVKDQSVYMEEGRKAAERVPITRVYVFEKPRDIEKPVVKETMEKDAQAGMKILYCLREEIAGVPEEKLDFGIWDGSYVCTVIYSDNGRVRFSLDSGKERMKEAKKHQKEILKVAREL